MNCFLADNISMIYTKNQGCALEMGCELLTN